MRVNRIIFVTFLLTKISSSELQLYFDGFKFQAANDTNFTEGAKMNVTHPVILLVGGTGSGKSTLGNMLLGRYNNGPFIVSPNMESVTQECGTATASFDGAMYNIVDTPGIFDTKRVTEEIYEEISNAVIKCAYGVKAILLLLEAKRFTAEQRNILEGIRTFLGADATEYMIVVFSNAKKEQTINKDIMREAWNKEVISLIKDVENRWGISPNPDLFSPNDSIYEARLGEIKSLITGMRGVFDSELLKKARRAQRQKEEDERKAKEEYEENLKIKIRHEADQLYIKKLEEITERSEKEKKELVDLLQNLMYSREKKNGGCFSLDTKVQLACGKFIEMAELQVGDHVCSNVKNGKLEFSEVYLISHLGHCNSFLDMIKIEYTNPDGQKGQIRMTPTHCIFCEDLSILYAQDVVPGKTKILVLNEANELVPVAVDDMTMEKDTSYISFYTRAGTVIANDILCSCYDDCPRSQALMDLVFAPIRWWTKVFPSTHRQKDLHPYVKTLETIYVTWCNVLNMGIGFYVVFFYIFLHVLFEKNFEKSSWEQEIKY